MIFKANKLYKITQSGISIPLTMMFAFIGTGFLLSYMNTIYEKDWTIEFNIAKEKAKINADTGIALGAYGQLFSRDFEEDYLVSNILIDENMGTYSLNAYERIDPETYQIVRGAACTGYANVRKHLYPGSKNVEVKHDRLIKLGHTSALSDFQYLTNTENSGGTPWSFSIGDDCLDSTNRREVNFGSGDVMNQGWGGGEPTCDIGFKTNGTFVMSSYGAPTFNITLSVIENPDGTYNSPIMNGNSMSVFQGDPPLDTVKATCLPPPGYDRMKKLIENDDNHLMLDATQKMNWVNGYFKRDTLIMTDIEFFAEADGPQGFKVKQWWYLMPPYLNENCSVSDGIECMMPNSTHMQAVDLDRDWDDDGSACDFSARVYTCDVYREQLRNFHSSDSDFLGNDIGIDIDWGANQMYDDPDNCINNSPKLNLTGFQHYDIPEIYEEVAPHNYRNPVSNATFNNNYDWVSQFEIDANDDDIPDHFLDEYKELEGAKTYFTDSPTAIYIKGGPVRVSGRYRGRYTIVTDEYITYKRHAWGVGYGAPKVDTLYTNIWITDDLINDDASGTSLLNVQPEEGCPVDGTDNRLGLVSGANIYIANSIENGARNSSLSNCNDNDPYDEDTDGFHSDRSNIVIHAHMIAFKESFATQYWQNTYDNPAVAGGSDDDHYSSPPFADGQGLLRYGGNSCNGYNADGDEYPDGTTLDSRGSITVWGGIVQSYRGYVVRNNPGPYPTGNIGYPSKSYNFDCNLKCPNGFPPLYPENTTCDEASDEIPYKVTEYY